MRPHPSRQTRAAGPGMHHHHRAVRCCTDGPLAVPCAGCALHLRPGCQRIASSSFCIPMHRTQGLRCAINLASPRLTAFYLGLDQIAQEINVARNYLCLATHITYAVQ